MRAGRTSALPAGSALLAAAVLAMSAAAGLACAAPPRDAGAQESSDAGGPVPDSRQVPGGEGPAYGGIEPAVLERYREAARSGEPLDLYNYGTALLRDGRWLEAREPLRRSTTGKIETVGRFGLYNYGLASGLAGSPGERDGPADPSGRREHLVRARDAFRDVLRRDPQDEDARWNLELVQRWLEEEGPGQGEGAGQGSSGGGAGGTGAGSDGSARPDGDARELGREQAEALLDAAGRAEADIRERLLGRARLRDPVVEKNW